MDKRYIARGQNAWGEGVNPRLAMQMARVHVPRLRRPAPGVACFRVDEVNVETFVTDDGALIPAGKLVGYYDFMGRAPTSGLDL